MSPGMQRRAVVGGLLGGVVVASSPVRGAADAPASAAAWLAWGPSGLWAGVAGASPVPQRIADGGVPFAPVAGGLWVAHAAPRLQRWQHRGDGVFEIVAERDLGGESAPAPATAQVPVHALAASRDGRWLLAALGENLVLLDGNGRVVRRYDGTDLERRRRGRAEGLRHHAGRRSFVVGWPAIGEWWEIPLDPAAAPIYDGLVHDYRMGEAIARPGHLGVRRLPLGIDAVPDLSFADDRVPWLAGRLGERVAVVHLDVRRRIAALPIANARPHAALWRCEGASGGAAPACRWWLPAGVRIVVIDPARWREVAEERLSGDVLALAAAGDLLWALVAQGDRNSLVMRRGDNAWQAVPLPEGVPRAIASAQAAADAAADTSAPGTGAALLVATTQPAALLLLTAQGRVLHRQSLPESTLVDGVLSLPPAAAR